MQSVYTLTFEGAVTTAKTLLQIKADAACTLEVLRAWITQSSTTTDDNGEALLLRYDTGATVTAAVLGTQLVKHNPKSQTPLADLGTTATGVDATGEGSVNIESVILEGFSVLAGWTWLPTPEERIIVPAGGFIGLKSNLDITSANIIAGVTFRELG